MIIIIQKRVFLSPELHPNHVDLTIADITTGAAKTLNPEMTAANFGNLAEDATPADLAAGAVNLVLQAIGTM